MVYRREINGLRAVAIIPVIFFHAGFIAFSGGFVGVDVFFVISGYLITSMILHEHEAGTFSLLGFYERRVRRIFPALFVVTLACLPCAWLWLKPADIKIFYLSLVAVSSFTSNVFFWQIRGENEVAVAIMPLLHTWSLSVEEQYYLLFPIFIKLSWKFGKNCVVYILAILAIISFALAQWFVSVHSIATFFLLPTRCWEMLIGGFVAFILRGKSRLEKDMAIDSLYSQSASAMGLVLISYSVFRFDRETPFPSVYTLMPTLGTAIVILYATKQTLVGKLLGSKTFVGVGLLSYGAYLWHQPLFSFARHKSLETLTTIELLGLTIASFVLAFFSWKYIETPSRERYFLNRIQIFFIATICSVALFTIGLVGYFTA